MNTEARRANLRRKFFELCPPVGRDDDDPTGAHQLNAESIGLPLDQYHVAMRAISAEHRVWQRSAEGGLYDLDYQPTGAETLAFVKSFV